MAGENDVRGVLFCLYRVGTVLMERRDNIGDWGLQWWFPAGKMGSGETPEEAMFREMREELSVEPVFYFRLPDVERPGGGVPYQMAPYTVTIWSGSVPVAVNDTRAQLGWVPVNVVLESPVPFIRDLMRAMLEDRHDLEPFGDRRVGIDRRIPDDTPQQGGNT